MFKVISVNWKLSCEWSSTRDTLTTMGKRHHRQSLVTKEIQTSSIRVTMFY